MGTYKDTNTGFEDEPPLLEELGINPDHIFQKTLTVLNPMRTTDASIAGDSDLAGPIVFAVAFGSFIMFSGKLYFNYIYGIGLLGCVAMYSLLNLMSVAGVSLTCSVCIGILSTTDCRSIWYLNTVFFIGGSWKYFDRSSCGMVCTLKQQVIC